MELSPDYDGARVRVDGVWHPIRQPLGISQNEEPVFLVQRPEGDLAVAKHVPNHIQPDDLETLNEAMALTHERASALPDSVMTRHISETVTPGQWMLSTYAGGKSLSSLDLPDVGTSERISVVNALMRAVRANLDRIHEAGLVFGDLNPDNVVVAPTALNVLMGDSSADISVTFIDPDLVGLIDSEQGRHDDDQGFQDLRDFLMTGGMSESDSVAA